MTLKKAVSPICGSFARHRKSWKLQLHHIQSESL